MNWINSILQHTKRLYIVNDCVSLKVSLDAPAIISSSSKLGFRFVWTAVTVLNYSHIFCSVRSRERLCWSKTPRGNTKRWYERRIKTNARAGVVVSPLAEEFEKSTFMWPDSPGKRAPSSIIFECHKFVGPK